MNVFFEIADYAVEGVGHKYLALYNVQSVVKYGHEARHYGFSERVWAEEKCGVKYLKNLRTPVSIAAVDMKEFFLIKLRSHTV